MSDSTSPSPPTALDQKSRHLLTFLIVCVSVVGVVVLSSLVVRGAANENKLDTVKFVFGAVLPLLASWVGTILAYYFSKDNFLAATQSVTELARTVSGLEKLRKVPAIEKMRSLSLIECEPVPAGKEPTTKLTDLLNRFASVERMLLVESKQTPVVRYLIYKSMVNDYFSRIAQGKTVPPQGKPVADLTLQDLLDSDAAKKTLVTTGFGFVSEAATLADAKAAMDAIDKCSDVFVTKTGIRTEPILGWITDNTIVENSQA